MCKQLDDQIKMVVPSPVGDTNVALTLKCGFNSQRSNYSLLVHHLYSVCTGSKNLSESVNFF